MNAYFDLENLESFLAQPNNSFKQDCIRLLKKQLDVNFNFKKEELKSKEHALMFLKSFADGVGSSTLKFSENKFPERNIKSNSHKDFTIDELLSAYFINDETLYKLKDKEELLIAEPGEELDLFRLLFLNNEDYKFDKKLRIGSQFKSWNDLQQFYRPFTDLIIVDNFLLSDISLIENNLIQILKQSVKAGVRKKINIVIFIKTDHYPANFGEIKAKMVDMIKNCCTDEPNITVVKHNTEHDRTIIKNNIRIYSGDSFNYFLSTGGKTTQGKEIHFSSIADKENYELFIELIKDLQKTLEIIPAANIIGDKQSRLLKFN
ncbi:hypothetical protein OBK22_06395 [Empedobacter falsenii]